ncbi:MAG: 2-amino-4-hydroxy-6-hydroxymethyldihydropteridine diphosphokinase [Candidatus Limnocylindrales bacterium]
MGRKIRAYIGLGANVGDARRTLTDAVAALAALPGARLRGVSRLYRTKPVGVTDQPDFLNAVVALDVAAGPDSATGATKLLVALKGLEREFGRRKRQRWGPRELDLDLLLFGRHRLAIERPPAGLPLSAAIDPGAATRLLEVPHPSMHDRLFVLAPMADLAPGLVPPGWSETTLTTAQRRRSAEGQGAAVPVGTWNEDDHAWIGPTEGPIVIEPAVPADAEGAARVHTASSEAAYRGHAPPEPDGFGRRTGLWREILANPANRSFLARDAGRVVGVMNLSPVGHPTPAGEIRVLYVLQEWWGSPAGQLLLDRAHAELALEHDAAQLTVLTANGRARRFYERNGWRLTETLVEPHFGGVPTEVSRYRRDLRSP